MEATVIVERTEVSISDVVEALAAGGLAPLDGESFPEDLQEFGGASDEPSISAAERLSEDVLARCGERANALGAGYPFDATVDTLSLRVEAAHDCYAFLLIADLGHHYPELKFAISPDSTSGRLLEKIVEGALIGLLGHARRFGWPIEPGWPSPIDDRVRRLGEELGFAVDDLRGKTDPADKDRTLDVLGVLRLPVGHSGSLAVLTQCAAGSNWKTKSGEPSVEAWQNLLIWDCKIVRAVALPWRLGGRTGDWSYGRAFQLFGGALILDRPRLASGHPDAHLDRAARDEIVSWYKTAADLIPRASLR